MIDAFIQQIPKVELQVHIEGTLEPELMFALAKRNKVKVYFASVEEARKAYHFKNLQSFLDVYYASMTVLVKEQDFYDLTMAYLKKAASQNIRHVEISFDPQAHLSRGVKFETVIRGMYRAVIEGQQKFRISAQLIMCIMRDLSVSEAQSVFEQSLQYKKWITAVGLDSEELNNPPQKFAPIFAEARSHGLFTVASAGEEGPPEYIWQALDALGAMRIGYAVHCLEDPSLVARLLKDKIPLMVCPLSNIKLHIVKKLMDHPIKKMLDQGLLVTINSDDPAYFSGYLNENFAIVNESLNITHENIYTMVRNSINASFMIPEKKQILLAEVDEFYKQAEKLSPVFEHP